MEPKYDTKTLVKLRYGTPRAKRENTVHLGTHKINTNIDTRKGKEPKYSTPSEMNTKYSTPKRKKLKYGAP